MALKVLHRFSGWLFAITISIVFFQNCSANFTTEEISSNDPGTLSPGNSKVVVSWTPPTMNTDATELTDLGGFKIFYGTTSGTYSDNLDVGNVSSYEFKNLNPNIYYFSVVAYDSEGNQSDYSEEVVADVRNLSF